MPTGRRQSGLTRLITVAMSLVVILASVIGMASHATERTHHQASGTSVELGLGSHNNLVDRHNAPSKRLGTSVAEGHQSSPAADHADCLDLICHGGWTITVVDGLLSGMVYSTVTFGWLDQMVTGGPATSLDRPPKALVHA